MMSVEKLPELRLDEKIRLVMPVGIINDEGRKEIDLILSSIPLPPLPDWWDYKTQVSGKGEYVGSFCKRVAKYFYQTENKKINSDILGKIGDVMSKHTDTNSEYVLDYTQKFNWRAGDYGDEGSCFWGCHAAARETLEEYKAYAVRFYNATKIPVKIGDWTSAYSHGIARAWVCKERNFYVVFNGYGFETSDIARIMAYHLGLSYRKIELTNFGEKEGLIWINGSKDKGEEYGSGFVIGPESLVHGMTEFDLSIEDTRSICISCGEVADSSCFYNDDIYCQSCFHDTFTLCEACEEYYYNDTMNECRSSDGRMWVCGDCMEDFIRCEYCGEYFLDDLITNVDDDNICNTCLSNHYLPCDDCLEYVRNSDITDGVCENCQTERDEKNEENEQNEQNEKEEEEKEEQEEQEEQEEIQLNISNTTATTFSF